MPTKPKEEETAVENEMPNVYQVFRVISKTGGNPQEGHWAVDEVNNYLSGFFKLGYTLFNTHYLGEMPEGFNMLYVLTK